MVGIGGLGHMAVKMTKAVGAHVVVITTSASKTENAKRLGADEVILSTDPEQFNQFAGSLHFILDAVSAPYNINAYLSSFKVDGTLVLVGVPMDPLPFVSFSLFMGRKSFSGSLIGGIKETQEMFDFLR